MRGATSVDEIGLMDLTDYQSLAARTLGRDRTREQQIANAALGLAGEAGEVADHIKKHLFHDFPLDEAEVVKELGDCLWYVAAMCTQSQAWLMRVATIAWAVSTRPEITSVTAAVMAK